MVSPSPWHVMQEPQTSERLSIYLTVKYILGISLSQKYLKAFFISSINLWKASLMSTPPSTTVPVIHMPFRKTMSAISLSQYCLDISNECVSSFGGFFGLGCVLSHPEYYDSV